jgi:hypothetical protein
MREKEQRLILFSFFLFSCFLSFFLFFFFPRLQAIVRVRKFLEQQASGDEQYAHLTAEDVAKVVAELEAKEKWLNTQSAAQAQLLKFVDLLPAPFLANKKK